MVALFFGIIIGSFLGYMLGFYKGMNLAKVILKEKLQSRIVRLRQ